MKTKTLFIVFSCFFLQSPLFSQEKIEDYTSRYNDLISIEAIGTTAKKIDRNTFKVSKEHLKIVLKDWKRVVENS